MRRSSGRGNAGRHIPPRALACLALTFILVHVSGGAHAQEAAPPGVTPEADLATKLANPVSSLISVPLQSNFDFHIGPDDEGWRYQLNVQPVVPIALGEDWRMVARTILPVIYQDDIFPGAGDQFGLGDITEEIFFVPSQPLIEHVTIGVGPAILIPTATDDLLGAEKLGLGPNAIVLMQQSGWTVGLLANHIWSIAGDDDRSDVSTTFLQPFINFTTADAWTYGVNTESSYDWEGDNWSVPINVFASKLLTIGTQRVSLGGGVRYWAESPDSGPKDFGARITFTLLFPE